MYRGHFLLQSLSSLARDDASTDWIIGRSTSHSGRQLSEFRKGTRQVVQQVIQLRFIHFNAFRATAASLYGEAPATSQQRFLSVPADPLLRPPLKGVRAFDQGHRSPLNLAS